MVWRELRCLQDYTKERYEAENGGTLTWPGDQEVQRQVQEERERQGVMRRAEDENRGQVQGTEQCAVGQAAIGDQVEKQETRRPRKGQKKKRK